MEQALKQSMENLTLTGVYGVYHQLYKTDPISLGSKRCESDNMKMLHARIKPHSRMFYGMSIQLDDSFQFDGDYTDILVQWKGFGSYPFITIVQKHTGLYIRVNAHPNDVFDPNQVGIVRK